MTLGLVKLLADTGCTDIPSADGKTDNFCTNLPGSAASNANLNTIVQIVVGTLAVIAVLIIVVSALNIVTAGGDSGKVAKARSSIIYALVGLAIVVSADVIVSLVVGKL